MGVLYRSKTMSIEAKYREVERALRGDLERGEWAVGDRLPSEYELSRRFGVSYMTTRQAVSLLVADGLLQRVSGKGTFVLTRPEILRQESHGLGTMALVVPVMDRIDPYYFPDVLEGFQGYVNDQGREAIVTDYAALEQTDRLPKGSAVACLLTKSDEAKIAEGLRDRGFLVLGINRYSGRRSIPWVAPENQRGAAAATERLLRLGHERIAFLRGDLENLDANERLKGYRQAMRKHGLPPMEAGNGFRANDGHRAAVELLDGPNPPTALVSASDLSALGAIKAARERGIEIPDRLSIIGFGNFSLLTYLDPALTTVDLPRVELGRMAARMLVALASGEAVKSETIPTHLVSRFTDGPPPVP